MTEFNPTVKALAEAILFTELNGSGKPLDNGFTVNDFDKDSLERLYCDYLQFIEEVDPLITSRIGNASWDSVDDFYDLMQPALYQTEYDYILTRNLHGSGFWDGNWSSHVSDILTNCARKKPMISVILADEKIYLR